MRITVLIPHNHLAQNGIRNQDEFCLAVLNALQDENPQANVEVKRVDRGNKPYIHQTFGSPSDTEAFIVAKTMAFSSSSYGTIHTQLKNGLMTFDYYPDGSIVGTVDGNPVIETDSTVPFDSDILQQFANVYQCGSENGYTAGVKAIQSRMRDVLGLEE